MGVFAFGRRARDDEARAADARAAERITGWVAAAGGFGPEVRLRASEVVCADPACPGTETIVLVMAPGRPTRAIRVAKPLTEVEEADALAALAEADGP